MPFTQRTDAGDNLLIAHFATLDLQALRNSLERSLAAEIAEMPSMATSDPPR